RLSALDMRTASDRDTCQLRPRRDRADSPLSIAQRDVWAESQLREPSALGTLATRVTLDGPLDEGAFLAALQAVVHRHDAFRLTFGERDGAPFQRLAAAGDLPVRVDDLTELGP